ncbi:hypothetical protein T439DRAFT_328401 [Meredithblackwellia eburnea MCA 4105]
MGTLASPSPIPAHILPPLLRRAESQPQPSPTPSTSTTFTASSTSSTITSATTLHADGLSPPGTPKLPLVRGGSDGAADGLTLLREIECADEGQPDSPTLEKVKDLEAKVVQEPKKLCDECGGSPPIILSSAPNPSYSGVTSDIEEKVRAPLKAGEFDRFGMPSLEALQVAADCELVGESGTTVRFGDLVHERKKVVVVFLRHLWCGLCQSYVVALKTAQTSLSTLSNSSASTHSLAESPLSPSSPKGATRTNFSKLPPVYILLISSGSPSLIPIYRARLECPFPLYVDKSRKLYKTLGMTRKTWDGGKESEKGSYVTQSQLKNVVSSTVNGLRMPRYPGDQKQLGGEFVFSTENDASTITCLYASRMSTTRNHSEVRDLFAAAGVSLSQDDAESVFGGSSA